MNTVIWVSAIASVLAVLVWLAALVWAAREDGRFARAYEKRHRGSANDPHREDRR